MGMGNADAGRVGSCLFCLLGCAIVDGRVEWLRFEIFVLDDHAVEIEVSLGLLSISLTFRVMLLRLVLNPD